MGVRRRISTCLNVDILFLKDKRANFVWVHVKDGSQQRWLWRQKTETFHLKRRHFISLGHISES